VCRYAWHGERCVRKNCQFEHEVAEVRGHEEIFHPRAGNAPEVDQGPAGPDDADSDDDEAVGGDFDGWDGGFYGIGSIYAGLELTDDGESACYLLALKLSAMLMTILVGLYDHAVLRLALCAFGIVCSAGVVLDLVSGDMASPRRVNNRLQRVTPLHMKRFWLGCVVAGSCALLVFLPLGRTVHVLLEVACTLAFIPSCITFRVDYEYELFTEGPVREIADTHRYVSMDHGAPRRSYVVGHVRIVRKRVSWALAFIPTLLDPVVDDGLVNIASLIAHRGSYAGRAMQKESDFLTRLNRQMDTLAAVGDDREQDFRDPDTDMGMRERVKLVAELMWRFRRQERGIMMPLRDF
jgi:hypothetical protein